MSEHSPAAELLDRWKAGDESAAGELYRRYAQRLCTIAEGQVGQRLASRVGAEDVVQSALRTFFRRAACGEFQIDHSGALWRLLVRITLNKVRRHGEYHRAQKRNVGAEVALGMERASPERLTKSPTHEESVELADELKLIFAGMSDRDQKIVQMRLEGYKLAEIANRAGCARRTVSLVLRRMGDLLRKRLVDTS